MPCELHLHHSNLRAMDYPLCGRVRSWLYKKIMKTIALILRLFKKQRETSQPLVAIKPKP